MEKIKDGVYYCGVEDCNRKLFDELIPLPNGTTYNSYLIKGSDKTALIDTSYSTKIQEFVECLNSDISKIDYILANHAEGDHSNALCKMLEMCTSAKIVTNAKCKEFLIDSYMINENKFIVVNDGDTISLGDKTLKFYIAPFVHWPDTMFTHIIEDNLLFTCDFLGAHDTKGVYAPETDDYLKSAKRYYSEIMMPFRVHCQKYTKKIEQEIKPDMILPSHGGIYKNPEFILNAYKDWTDDKPKNKVVLPYVSMYQNTKNMIEYLAKRLNNEGIETVCFDIVGGDLGELAIELVDCATIVFGSSMVLAHPHPYALLGVYIANLLRPKAKFLSIVGSYGWGGNLISTIEDNIKMLKVEKLPYVTVKGCAKDETFTELDELARIIILKHQSIELP